LPFLYLSGMSEIIGNKFIVNKDVVDVTGFPEFQNLAESFPSVYEVVRVENGIPLFMEDYLNRLNNSFDSLQLKSHMPDESIVKAIQKLTHINALDSGPVKLVFGVGEKDFFMAYFMQPHLPSPEEYVSGVNTIFMYETREYPSLKIWNKGLRKRSVELLKKTGAYEAILVNAGGFITEASRSNVFFIRDNKIFTTPVELVLPGITRKKVLKVCEENGIEVDFTRMKVQDLHKYDSCFLTGTTRKIVPVKTIDEVSFQVNTAILKNVSRYFEKFVNRYLEMQGSK